MENGTSIEYFNNGCIMQVKDKIKVYEEGKKAARTLTQAQQTKLLLEARVGGQTKQPKRTLKRHVEQNSDDAEDEVSGNERKYSRSDQAVSAYSQDFPINSDDELEDQTIVEQPRQTPKSKPMKTMKKQPQINYTSPQVDLEELIRLRTENQFIKQQHQDSVKQVEKYKAKIKSYKSKKYQEEQQESQQQSEPIQEQEQEQAQEIQFRDCDSI
ncbi:MAG: hypothetical protein EZS28_039661 [Streblomastix strix]|uniref:Uncharacterized protein n=1 Tax=Streblomastix strix TaxID=222440 RepID=A0A5J4U3I5_9EUKA|nr:MAG: hypothetical protein EZS28_039661 [Streblomastix strix]